MRKLLLASTALVGAVTLVHQADAQQLTTDSPFVVRIDGFMNFRGGIVGDSNQTAVQAVPTNPVRVAAPKARSLGDQFRTDTEIHITATGKADNGLVYGMYVEIEADPALNMLTTSSVNAAGATGVATQTTSGTSGQNYIDEANIFLQGSWGRLELGDQDGAGDQLFFGAPFDYGPAYGQGSGADGDILFRWVNAVGITNATSNINGAPLYTWNVRALDSSDATKITYLSPVIAGFRGGISFVPDGAQNGFLPANGAGGRSSYTLTSLTAANIGVVGNGGFTGLGATGAQGLTRTVGSYSDFDHWIETGIQWRGTFGDVGLGAMFEYTHAQHKSSLFTPTAGVTTGAQFGGAGVGPYHYVDINSWAFGAQVSWMGLTAGGSYSNGGRSTYLSGPGLQRGVDQSAYVLGIQYAIGPWVVGYNYSFSIDGGVTSPLNVTATGGQGTDINEWHSLGAKYILAPGLFLFTEYGHADIKYAGGYVNHSNVGIVGTGIRF